MSKTVQIRNVPEQVHRILKARAAREGMSLSAFIRRELERSAELPTMREWLDRTARSTPLRTGLTAVQIVRQLRDGARY
jgi:antitoxin FitA